MTNRSHGAPHIVRDLLPQQLALTASVYSSHLQRQDQLTTNSYLGHVIVARNLDNDIYLNLDDIREIYTRDS